MLNLIKRLLTHRSSTAYFWKLREKLVGARKTPLYYYRQLKYNRFMRRCGCLIPLTTEIHSRPTFPHGLSGIFISQGASIGHDVTIFQQVTIGSNTLADSKGRGAPVICDGVYIGAGAKIIGGIVVGDNTRIGANAVVFSDIPANSTVVLPSPRIITHQQPRDNTFVIYDKEEQHV